MPRLREHLGGHQEVGGEPVRLPLLGHVLVAAVDAVGAKMQQQVAQFVGCGEDPSLDRDPLPDVDHDRRAAVILRHGQAEEPVVGDAERVHLDAVVLQQLADVADRILWPQPRAAPGGLGQLLQAFRALGLAGDLGTGKCKPLVLAQQAFQLAVRLQPARHPHQDLLAAGHLLLAETHRLQRMDLDHQVGDLHAQGRCQAGQGAGPRLGRAGFDVPVRNPRNPRPLRDLCLAQAPLVAETTEVVGKGGIVH